MNEWTSLLPCLTPLAALALFGSGGRPRSIGPAVAGHWYPADPDGLARQVDGYLSNAPPTKPSGPVLALIAPHAGYVYSGGVAGKGFSLVQGARYARVILMGPSHHSGFQGAAVPEAEIYRTPLGEVPLDTETIASLGTRPGFSVAEGPFGPEHSLESEIPFLQRTLEPGWRLVPVLIGRTGSEEAARLLADGLRPLLEPETLVVVSTDFTHFGRGFAYVPFTTDVPERLRDLDLGAVRRIEQLDASGFDDYVGDTGATICGRNAISVLLRMLPDDTRGSLVAYDTSGRMTGDWTHTVSYAALAFHGPEVDGEEA